MQPTTVTIQITLGDSVDIAGVLAALASAGIDTPRPENTQPAPATVVALTSVPTGPTEQLQLPLRRPIHHHHPVPRDYQPADPSVAAWSQTWNGVQLLELCRRWRKGPGSALWVLEQLATRNGTLACRYYDHQTFADWAGVTLAIGTASLRLLAAVDAIVVDRDDHGLMVTVNRQVLAA